jgi:hypothetical protein
LENKSSEKNDYFIKVAFDWIGRKKENGLRLLPVFGLDGLYLSSLIMFRYTYGNRSRFTLTEIEAWFGNCQGKRERVLEKAKILNIMAEEEMFNLHMPYKGHYYLKELHDIFMPTGSFVRIYEDEVNTIIMLNTSTGKSKISNAHLYAVYVTIKSYISKSNPVAYPTIEDIVSHTGISNKTIATCIDMLMDMKLIYYQSRGFDKVNTKNIGNVYVLWSEDARQQVSGWIENNITKSARSKTRNGKGGRDGIDSS